MPNTLRVKSSLTESELNVLTDAVYDFARSHNVPLAFDQKTARSLVMYAVRQEVGSFASAGGFPTNLSNGAFAGILQTGVDGLIEGNALTKNTQFKAVAPITWTMFPQGIHPAYTMSNRKKALNLHSSWKTLPQNVVGTATDSLVSIARYLDTVNRAISMSVKYRGRQPSQVEVYMYHIFGWPRMDAFMRLMGGKGSTKDRKLVATMPKDLALQSRQAQQLVRPVLSEVV